MDEDKRKAYWKQNLTYLFSLLAIWFCVSYGAAIIFAEQLNNYKFMGLKLGFWFAQQGSIYVFVVLIFTYTFLMNKLDKKYGFDEGEVAVDDTTEEVSTDESKVDSSDNEESK
ncbi:MAG: DUF4212 domain-containing protein [Lentisphaeria bacterium]|nr:DUF4212 domain-containing protein [Lentisphaeria bacterium]